MKNYYKTMQSSYIEILGANNWYEMGYVQKIRRRWFQMGEKITKV